MAERTVFILDDNKDFRESTGWMLEGAGYRVQGFAEPEPALKKFAELDKATPCCVLLDVRMPGMSGLDVHDAMNERAIDVPVVYMTGHGDVPLAVEAMKKGALTFLEKPLQSEALEAALDTAFSPAVQQARGVRPDRASIDDFRQRTNTLTRREAEVINKVVEGNTNMVIGVHLNISVKTVELHRSRATKKLGVRSVPQLVKMVLACR